MYLVPGMYALLQDFSSESCYSNNGGGAKNRNASINLTEWFTLCTR